MGPDNDAASSRGNAPKPIVKTTRSAGLKELADYLGLAPATVSLIMNAAPAAETIPISTRNRVFEGARKLGYRPNFFAKCLRAGRSFTIGVMTPEVSEGYNATVLSGIEDHLLREGYFYLVVSHRFQPDLIEEYPDLLQYRGVDGLIVLTAPWNKELAIPVVTISCHHEVKGATRIILDHHRAGELALQHLWGLGHREIAVIMGQSFTPDSEIRWKAIAEVAHKAGKPIPKEFVVQLQDNLASPDLGYRAAKDLLSRGKHFTALFAFNDLAAIGSIRALHEHGMHVPRDVSVVGFDDIDSAAYQNPPLTTVRQPLKEMGRMAAQTVLAQIGIEHNDGQEIVVEPELIVRGTTAPVFTKPASKRKEPAAAAR